MIVKYTTKQVGDIFHKKSTECF